MKPVAETGIGPIIQSLLALGVIADCPDCSCNTSFSCHKGITTYMMENGARLTNSE